VFVAHDGVLYATHQRFLPAGHHWRDVIQIAQSLGFEVRAATLAYRPHADEASCGTAAEVTPIASVDGQEIGRDHKADPGCVLRDRRGRNELCRVPRISGTRRWPSAG
jgi:branched-subunit amino acid aminotransferase/4-amino-4-deoxychorismate lyase